MQTEKFRVLSRKNDWKYWTYVRFARLPGVSNIYGNNISDHGSVA